MRNKVSSKELRLKRLENDILHIEKEEYSFVEYYGNEIDAQLYAMERKKRSLIRALILEKHLAIEDFINSLIEVNLLKSIKMKRSPLEAVKYFNRLFEDGKNFLSGNYSLSFKKKITLLRIMRVIGKKMYEDLDILNSLRNNCGHIWSIEEVKRRGTKRDKRKKYFLNFKGKNLFDSKVFIAFSKKYRDIFLEIAELL